MKVDVKKLNGLSERILESIKPFNPLEKKLKTNSSLSQEKIDFLVHINKEFKSSKQQGYIYLTLDEMSKEMNSLDLFVNNEENKKAILDCAEQYSKTHEKIFPYVHVSKPNLGKLYSFIYFNP